MKISEMMGKLNKLKQKYGDLDLVYSADDDGNYFNTVNFDPTPGIYNPEENQFSEIGRKEKPTHICIN